MRLQHRTVRCAAARGTIRAATRHGTRRKTRSLPSTPAPRACRDDTEERSTTHGAAHAPPCRAQACAVRGCRLLRSPPPHPKSLPRCEVQRRPRPEGTEPQVPPEAGPKGSRHQARRWGPRFGGSHPKTGVPPGRRVGEWAGRGGKGRELERERGGRAAAPSGCTDCGKELIVEGRGLPGASTSPASRVARRSSRQRPRASGGLGRRGGSGGWRGRRERTSGAAAARPSPVPVAGLGSAGQKRWKRSWFA